MQNNNNNIRVVEFLLISNAWGSGLDFPTMIDTFHIMSQLHLNEKQFLPQNLVLELPIWEDRKTIKRLGKGKDTEI